MRDYIVKEVLHFSYQGENTTMVMGFLFNSEIHAIEEKGLKVTPIKVGYNLISKSKTNT